MLAAMQPGSDPTSSSTSHRAGATVSVLAHVVLVGTVLLLAEVHPFAEVPEQRIEVEVVTADEAPPPVPEKEPEPKPVEQPTPNFEVSQAPTEQPKQQPAPTAKLQPPETKPPAPAPQPPQHSAQAPTPPPQRQPAPQPQPAPQGAAAPYPPAIPQEPDITVKYSVALGLPAEGGFDAPAETVANISADAVAALRKRLKACAALPAGLSPSDNVKIVIRVGLTPDGRLAQEPFL
ncbi:hypothetical protein DYI24_21780, partial [Rhodopseudomonas sp. BR0C11]|nr:hypothetical protein [Rhodopseudomonas sp. BR0C11]